MVYYIGDDFLCVQKVTSQLVFLFNCLHTEYMSKYLQITFTIITNPLTLDFQICLIRVAIHFQLSVWIFDLLCFFTGLPAICEK